MSSSTLTKCAVWSLCLLLVLSALMSSLSPSGSAVSAGGHKKGAHGTACLVKGSYCSCHYCKCEKGWVYCKGKKHGYGKKFCYGSMEGQYCHCDYCKCKKGYGSTGKHGKCH